MIKRVNEKKKKGFTLIELIIVLAVMAIIALIAIPNFTAVRDNSKLKADERSCEIIERAVLMLTASESVTVNSDTDIEFEVGGVITPAAGATDDVTGNGLTDAEITLINEALAEVNQPQEKGKTKYSFTINEDGTVTLPTTN